MNIIKKVLPIAVICILLSITFSPTTVADDPTEEDLTLEIGYKDNSGNFFFKELVVSEEDYLEFETKFEDWNTFVDECDSDGVMDISELLEFEDRTVDLVEDIKEMTYDEDLGEYLFPDSIVISSFIHEYLLLKGFSRKLFAFGRGRAWLPFNRHGESFIGMRFLPMKIDYALGYSKTRLINFFPPSVGTIDRLGTHNVWIIGFVGLYINFGDRYLDRPAGPVLLIGKGLWFKLGQDIP